LTKLCKSQLEQDIILFVQWAWVLLPQPAGSPSPKACCRSVGAVAQTAFAPKIKTERGGLSNCGVRLQETARLIGQLPG